MKKIIITSLMFLLLIGLVNATEYTLVSNNQDCLNINTMTLEIGHSDDDIYDYVCLNGITETYQDLKGYSAEFYDFDQETCSVYDYSEDENMELYPTSEADNSFCAFGYIDAEVTVQLYIISYNGIVGTFPNQYTELILSDEAPVIPLVCDETFSNAPCDLLGAYNYTTANVAVSFSSITGSLISGDIQSDTNWVYVNSSSVANVPATITFYGVSSGDIPYRDGEICDAECSNIINNGTVLTFDTSGWSNYSYGPSVCTDGNLSTVCYCNEDFTYWENNNCYIPSNITYGGGSYVINGTMTFQSSVDTHIYGNNSILNFTGAGQYTSGATTNYWYADINDLTINKLDNDTSVFYGNFRNTNIDFNNVAIYGNTINAYAIYLNINYYPYDYGHTGFNNFTITGFTNGIYQSNGYVTDLLINNSYINVTTRSYYHPQGTYGPSGYNIIGDISNNIFVGEFYTTPFSNSKLINNLFNKGSVGTYDIISTPGRNAGTFVMQSIYDTYYRQRQIIGPVNENVRSCTALGGIIYYGSVDYVNKEEFINLNTSDNTCGNGNSFIFTSAVTNGNYNTSLYAIGDSWISKPSSYANILYFRGLNNKIPYIPFKDGSIFNTTYTLNNGILNYSVSSAGNYSYGELPPIILNNPPNNSTVGTYGELSINTTLNVSVFNYYDIMRFYNGHYFDINYFNYNNPVYFYTTKSAPFGTFMNSEGTKLYVNDNTGGARYIYEYNISNFNISTATLNHYISRFGSDTNVVNLFFKPDGTQMYYLSTGTSHRIAQATLSIPWDISTAVYNKSFITPVTGGGGFTIGNNGKKLYFIKTPSPYYIYEYNLTTPWDISSAVLYQTRLDTTVHNIQFNSDGTKAILGYGGYSFLLQRDLNNPWDISTFTNEISVSIPFTIPYGLYIDYSGGFFTISDSANDRIIQVFSAKILDEQNISTNNTYDWNNLDENTTHNWFVYASTENYSDSVNSDIWNFTTISLECDSTLSFTPCKIRKYLALIPDSYVINDSIYIYDNGTLDGLGSTITASGVSDGLIRFIGNSNSSLKNVSIINDNTVINVIGNNSVVEYVFITDITTGTPIEVQNTATNFTLRNSNVVYGVNNGLISYGGQGVELYDNLFTGVTPCFRLASGISDISRYGNNTKPDTSNCKIRFDNTGNILKYVTDNVELNFVGGNQYTNAAYILENTVKTGYKWAYVSTGGMFDTNTNILYKNLITNGDYYNVYKNTVEQIETLDYTNINSTSNSLEIGVVGWSNWTIDILPVVSEAYITPQYPLGNDDLHCNFMINKTDTRDVDVNISWYQSDNNITWLHIVTYNYQYVNITNATPYVTTVGTGSYTGALVDNRRYVCEIITDNGETISGVNSTVKKVNPLNVPVLISPEDTFFTNNPQMVATFNVIDDDGGIECSLDTEYTDILNSMVAGWQLNNNSIDVVNGNNGLGTDLSSAINEYGRFGYATTFNGITSNIIIPNNYLHDLGSGEKTITFKMKSQPAWTSTYARILSKRDVNNGYSISLNNNNVLMVELEENNTGVIQFNGTVELNDNIWHNIIITFNRTGDLTIYVDGIIDVAYDISSFNTNITSPSDTYIGTDILSGQVYDYNGDLDDIIIYNRLLSSSEIAMTNIITGSLINGPFNLYDDNVTNGVNTSTLTINFGEEQSNSWSVICIANGNPTPVSSATYSYVVDYSDTVINTGISDETLLTPEIGGIINVETSVSDNYEVANCTFEVNDNGTWQELNITIINAISGLLNNQYTIRNVSRGRINNSNVYWRFSCYDTAGNQNDGPINIVTVKDVTDPVIMLNPNNAFQSENDSIVSGNISKNLNITFADWNLFQAEVNISCLSSGDIYYWQNLDINTIEYTLNDNFSIAGLPLQACVVYIAASDDHTVNEIPKYKVQHNNNNLTFLTEHGINIEIVSDDLDIRRIDDNKLTDRYTFNFKYNDVLYERLFTIKSDTKLYYREKSNYPGHFVAWDDEKKVGNWIDMNYVNKGNRNISYNVMYVNDYEYNVKVTSKVPDIAWTTMTLRQIQNTYGLEDMDFQSIGGVNTENITYDFYIGGAVTLTGRNIFDNSSIDDWTIQVTTIDARPPFNGIFTINGSSDVLEDVANGTYRLDFSHPYFFPQTEYVTVDNTTQLIEWVSQQSIVNVQAANIATLDLLSNVNVTIWNIGYGYNETRIGDNITYTQTFLLDAGTYNIKIDAPNYLPYTGTFTVGYQENITIPKQISFLANIYLWDERYNIPFNMSSPDIIRFRLFCPNETKETILTNVSTSLLIDCQYEKFQFVLGYGVVSYYRSLILSPDEAFNYDVYLIDLATTTSLYTTFTADDLISEYDDIKIFVKKIVGNKTVIITSDAIDAEGKIGAYLMENSQYILEVHSSNNPIRVMGTYFANEEGDKSLRLYDIELQPNPETFLSTVTYTVGLLNESGSKILAATYTDVNNQTNSVTWNIYSNTYPGTLVFTSTVSDESNIEFTFNLTANNLTNTTLYSDMIINHQQGVFRYTKLVQEYNMIVLGIFNYVSQSFMNWFFTIFLSVLAIFATVKSSNLVSLMMLLMAALFVIFGWYSVTWGILGLGLLFSLISLLKEGEKGL